MGIATTLAVTLGPVLAKQILEIWFKDRNLLQSIGGSLIDLVAAKTQDELARLRLERRFLTIGEEVAASLKLLFKRDGERLHDHEEKAVVLAIADAISHTRLDAEAIVNDRFSVDALLERLRIATPNATRDFSAAAANLMTGHLSNWRSAS